MEVNLTIIQLALIFLPGIIWASIHRRFNSIEKPTNFHFLLNCFLFGIVAYAATFFLYSAFGQTHPIARYFDQPDKIPAAVFSFGHLTLTVLVATALAVAWTYIETYKLISRILKRIGATKRFGDEDVWDFTFNSSRPHVEYVQMRDFDKSIVYSGWVDAFSESGKLRELFLRDAQVYDFDGKHLYDMPYIYIARAPDDIQVDFPYEEPRGGAQEVTDAPEED